MGVRRYRSVEDMPAGSPRRPLDPENLVIAFGLMDLAHRIAALSFRPASNYRSHDERCARTVPPENPVAAFPIKYAPARPRRPAVLPVPTRGIGYTLASW
jgi:hypothetical protein